MAWPAIAVVQCASILSSLASLQVVSAYVSAVVVVRKVALGVLLTIRRDAQSMRPHGSPVPKMSFAARCFTPSAAIGKRRRSSPKSTSRYRFSVDRRCARTTWSAGPTARLHKPSLTSSRAMISLVRSLRPLQQRSPPGLAGVNRSRSSPRRRRRSSAGSPNVSGHAHTQISCPTDGIDFPFGTEAADIPRINFTGRFAGGRERWWPMVRQSLRRSAGGICRSIP